MIYITAAYIRDSTHFLVFRWLERRRRSFRLMQIASQKVKAFSLAGQHESSVAERAKIFWAQIKCWETKYAQTYLDLDDCIKLDIYRAYDGCNGGWLCIAHEWDDISNIAISMPIVLSAALLGA